MNVRWRGSTGDIPAPMGALIDLDDLGHASGPLLRILATAGSEHPEAGKRLQHLALTKWRDGPGVAFHVRIADATDLAKTVRAIDATHSIGMDKAFLLLAILGWEYLFGTTYIGAAEGVLS